MHSFMTFFGFDDNRNLYIHAGMCVCVCDA